MLITACQTLGEHQRADMLVSTLRSYEAAIRWTSGKQLQPFLPPNKDDKETTVETSSKPIRVTHYEVVQGPSMIEENRAVQTAVIQYVLQERQIVRELTDQQDWRYHEDTETWHLYSPPPKFE
jgi:hypothetical protein